MVLGGETTLAGLECSQDLVAELNGIGEGFQARGKRRVLVVTEVAVLYPCRQYQVVVGQGERNAIHEAPLFLNTPSRAGALDPGGVGLPAQPVAVGAPMCSGARIEVATW